MKLDVLWEDKAWNEFMEWNTFDPKTANKILDLIYSIKKDGVLKGLGKPEGLKGRKECSRRINDKDRLIYRVENNLLNILSCKGHYC